jgi:hypothetical protein
LNRGLKVLFFCCCFCCCGHVVNALALSKRSSMSTARRAQAFRFCCGRVRRRLSQEVGVVDEAIELGVGVGGIADQRMPLVDR